MHANVNKLGTPILQQCQKTNIESINSFLPLSISFIMKRDRQDEDSSMPTFITGARKEVHSVGRQTCALHNFRVMDKAITGRTVKLIGRTNQDGC